MAVYFFDDLSDCGQAVLDDLGMQLKDITVDMLGQAKSVKVTKEHTTIVDGKTKRSLILFLKFK